MASAEPLSSLEDVQRARPKILIVGSGPAAVAMAECLYLRDDDSLTIGILERGGILALQHVNNFLRGRPTKFTDDPPGLTEDSTPVDRRRDFLTKHEKHPWRGDFAEAGMMLFTL